MAFLGVEGREDRKAVRMTTTSITMNGISHVHDLENAMSEESTTAESIRRLANGMTPCDTMRVAVQEESKGGSICAFFFFDGYFDDSADPVFDACINGGF